ncbi:unnamed protein product [Didymodactylos carnosus]|uniref:Uncharacterized protein n=1 Tax=Didymodactylos carnosus TaxID=1234261 RepID=A0A8S2E507_9BILA|nr:unnamed protein product [Didymodactylos carnosus]CAF3834237.1 unnamed protein product [Didymodactylos carnosus]
MPDSLVSLDEESRWEAVLETYLDCIKVGNSKRNTVTINIPLSKRKAHNRNLLSKRWCTGNFFDKPPQQQSSSSEDGEFINLQPDTIDFTNKQISTDIGDLYTLCAQQCHAKFLSTMIYMILRHLNLSWRDTDQFLSSFGTISILTCHKWAKTFLCKDFNDFVNKNRGEKHTDGFYDVFPELKIQGRAFVVDACSQKSSSFKAADLATFIDERYYKINNLKKSANNLIRSIENYRLDIRRWGGRHEANSNRPYFEDLERADVIAHRKEFIQHFLPRKAEYYTITNDESPNWIIPTTPHRTILICK